MLVQLWLALQGAVLALGLAFFNKLWDPVATQIGYTVDLQSRIEEMLDAVDKVRRIQVDLSRLDPIPFSERSKGWRLGVRELHTKARAVKDEYDECLDTRLTYFAKCKLGKLADRQLKKAAELSIDGKDLMQEALARPNPVSTAMFQDQDPHIDLCGGMTAYKDMLLEFLKHKERTPIPQLGIWGMAGVGKSALLKTLRDSEEPYNHFDYVLFVQAGMGCTIKDMQDQISARLGLPPVNESLQSTVIQNHLRFKSFLLLIDDLWDKVDLGDVGVPMPLGSVDARPIEGISVQRQRKVVFTTRSRLVCEKMRCCGNTIHMGRLNRKDSWKLFTNNVGYEIADDSPFHQSAKKMCDECDGLPKALCTIGRAMSNKRESSDWISAVSLLMKSRLSEVNDKDEELFKCLKMSWDALPKQTWKDCFLLCSLWLQDENIPRIKLIEWWIGAGLLEEQDPIVSGQAIINHFVDSSLLEHGDAGPYTSETSHVKMHRMMRRMALWVVNGSGDCVRWLPHAVCKRDMPSEKWTTVQKIWISPAEKRRFSSFVSCPQLTMLVTRDVLPLKSMCSFRQILSLDLEGATRDVFPMEICSLTKLQYLSISGTKIKTLPWRLRELSNLKYLYMRDCSNLETIAEGLNFLLKRLVVLDLLCPGGANNIQYFASLMKELQCDNPDVVTLGINLRNRADVTEVVESGRVCTCGVCLDCFEDESNPGTIDLSLLSPLNSLLELTVVKSPLCTELVAEGSHRKTSQWMFPNLQTLELRCLQKLQEVRWLNAGKDIRVVTLYKCCKLRHATWVLNLPSLKELIVTYCSEIEQIIDSTKINVVANSMTSGFAVLQRLYLEQLPQLSNLSDCAFPFEELSYVCVDGCDNLKGIKVEGRINTRNITIDCSSSWWTSAMMSRHFTKTEETQFVSG